MRKKAYKRKLFLFIIILFLLAFACLCVGRYSNNPVDVWNALLGKLGGAEAADNTMDSILFAIRIPRVAAAMMVGAMLSLAGMVYQGIFRNPLVSPDMLGVSSGATVGAAAAVLLGLGLPGRQVLAFLGGLLAVAITTNIPKLLRNNSNLTYVLAGIIVSGFFASVLSIMKFVAEEQTELAAIVFWQMGSLATLGNLELAAVSPIFLGGSALLIGLSWQINILSFGDIEARTIGVNLPQIRGVAILGATLVTASAVSISGSIGWIGLVIPHFARLLTGSDHTRAIPMAMVVGALFMLVIDTVARTALTVEIPLSILTGLVGAPCFLGLLIKQKSTVY